MKIVDMTATGDDNLLSDEEKTDLEYRKLQLKRLQEEVVDIEDMTTGISIMDLGLNEFRMDLLEYIKHHDDIDKTPFGLHAVVSATEDMPEGVIYVLKNRSNSVNIDNQNRLHPFYMVYISNDGKVVCDHLSPKDMLDKMRFLCKGKTEPDANLCKEFNKETHDGKDMSEFSKLLGDAIASIIEVKEESDIDSFLGGGQVSFLSNEIKGLDDFELICFLVIKDQTKVDASTEEYKLVIAGSREFKDYSLLSETLDKHLKNRARNKAITIISGTAKGADQLGEQYAKEKGYKIEYYPADWERYGNAAGPIRNTQMAKAADDVIVFWDGKSAGTRNMMEAAEKENIPCTVIRIDR